MRQVYVSSLLNPGAMAEIEGEDYRHLTLSLRAKVGESLRLVDSEYRAFEGCIASISRHGVAVRVERALQEAAAEMPLTLGLCIPAADAFDAALDASVQLGVTTFAPLLSQRARNVDDSKADRWERIARQSCCQCLRSRPPQLLAPQPLEQFLVTPQPGKRVLAWQEAPRGPWERLPSNEAVTVLIGPEGGFDDDELALARKSGWEFLWLGEQVLRVPVAVAAALSVLKHLRQGAVA